MLKLLLGNADANSGGTRAIITRQSVLAEVHSSCRHGIHVTVQVYMHAVAARRACSRVRVRRGCGGVARSQRAGEHSAREESC
jgi:hypothetical protein